MTIRIVHKNSTAEDKRPTAGQLANGEIAVNLSDTGAFLSVKDSAGNIQQVGGVKVSSSPPANPVKGTLWVDADVDSLYIYDGNTWRGLTGGTGSGGDDVIAGNGLDETQSGNVVTLFVVGGEAIRVDSNGVHVDLEADASRTGGNGLEINGDKLRAKLATPTNLGVVQVDDSTIEVTPDGQISAAVATASSVGVVQVDDSTIKVTPDGQISAVTNTPLNYKGNLDIVNGGSTDPQPTSPLLGDTYTSAQTGTIFTPWTNLLDNPPTNTTAGDLIICQADGGGNGNWVLVPAAGNNPWIDSNTGYVYLADPANGVRVQALANGNESLTGTDLAMIDDLGQLVRAAPGTGLGITGGQLTNTLPTYWSNPSGTDLKPNNTAYKIMADTLADGQDQATGTSVAMLDDDGRLVRADPKSGIEIDAGQLQIDQSALPTFWTNPASTDDLKPDNTAHKIMADTLANGTEGTTGTSVGMLDDDGRFVRADPGAGLTINGSGQLEALAQAQYWDRTGTTLSPATDGDTVTVTNGAGSDVITLNSDGTAEFTSDVTLSGTGVIKAPAGTTAQRPGTPAAGMFRFNSDAGKFEGYDGTTWSDVGSVSAWQRVGTTLSPNNDGDTVTVTDGSGNAVITFNPDGTAEFTGDVTISSDGFLKLPVGTDLERPGTPAAGMVRYTNQNTTPPVTGTQRGYLDITTSTTEPTTAVGDTYTVQVAGAITTQWQGFLSNEPAAAVVGDYVVCQVAGGGNGNWSYVSTSDPANFVEMYNGTDWVQMLDETIVGTSPDQCPANQMLGQMAFIDNVATLRPYTTPLASTLPVFVGECIVIWDPATNNLVYRYRDTATTYREATVAFGSQVTG